jgi:hypothetical protein
MSKSKYQVSIESWNRPDSFEKIKETKGWLREDSSVDVDDYIFVGVFTLLVQQLVGVGN